MLWLFGAIVSHTPLNWALDEDWYKISYCQDKFKLSSLIRLGIALSVNTFFKVKYNKSIKYQQDMSCHMIDSHMCVY